MALSMTEKPAERSEQSAWSPELVAEFEREAKNPNPCVGSSLLSENERVRVWEIRLRPGERIGFHRHVLNYFWTSVTGGRGRQHLMDGNTPTTRAKRGTKAMHQGNTRCTTWKTSPTRRWCS